MYRLGCASLCVPFLCVFLREIFSQERTCCVHMAAKSKRVTASTEQPRFKLKRHDIDDEYRWLCDSLYSGHHIVERRMTQSLISLASFRELSIAIIPVTSTATRMSKAERVLSFLCLLRLRIFSLF